MGVMDVLACPTAQVSPMKWRLEHDFVHFGQQSQSALANADDADQIRDLETQSEIETQEATPVTSLEQIIALFAQVRRFPSHKRSIQKVANSASSGSRNGAKFHFCRQAERSEAQGS